MDSARVFVWRVRLLLLAMALGLVGVGTERTAPVSQPIQRSQPVPTVQTVAALSTQPRAVQVSSGPVSRPLSQSPQRARQRTVAPPPLELRCSARAAKSSDRVLAAGKSTRAQKSNGCKLATGGNMNIKKAVSGHAKPAPSFAKKRDTSIGAVRHADSPKARHKVARKGDAAPSRNIAAVRQARGRQQA